MSTRAAESRRAARRCVGRRAPARGLGAGRGRGHAPAHRARRATPSSIPRSACACRCRASTSARAPRRRAQPARPGVLPRSRPRPARRHRRSSPGSAACSRPRASPPTARSCCTLPAGAGLRVQPGQLLGVPRRAGRGARRAVRGATTRSASAPLPACPRRRPPDRSGETLRARKVFHVSPFCAVRGRVRVPLPLRRGALARAHRLLRR